MIKAFKFFVLSGIIILSLLVPATAYAAPVDNGQTPLEQRLIGTWRWDTGRSWIMVFREDGTMLDGFPGLRTTYNWQVVNNRLFVNGVDWNIRITDNTITLDRYGRSTYTYVWYSSSTDGDTSLWLLAIIGIMILTAFAAIVAVVTWLIIRRRGRQRDQQYQQYQQYYHTP